MSWSRHEYQISCTTVCLRDIPSPPPQGARKHRSEKRSEIFTHRR
jgi:hypothetical protein